MDQIEWKLLLVEADPGVVRLVRQMLDDAGHKRSRPNCRLISVRQIEQAITVLKQETFDLILLDLSLPQSHGLDTLQTILKQVPTVPVIMLSEVDDEALALEAIRTGAQDYLVKSCLNEFSLSRAIHYAIERKRAVESLKKSEAKLATLFEILPIGISILDEEGNIVKNNPALHRILDMPESGLKNKTYRNRVYLRPDWSVMPAEEFPSNRAVAEKTTITNEEIGIIKEDGTDVWVNVNAVPVDFPDWKIILTTADVTGRKHADEALRQSNTFNQTVLNSLVANIAVLDKTGTIVAVNRAWEEFARSNGAPSLSRSGVGLNYLEVCRQATGADGATAQAALTGIKAVLEGRQPQFILEYPCHSPGEERWFSMQVVPLLKGEVGAVVAHDNITERKLAEVKIERRNRELSLLNHVIAASVKNQEPQAILEIACRELALTLDLPQVTALGFNADRTEAVLMAEHRNNGYSAKLEVPPNLTNRSSIEYLLNQRGPLITNQAVVTTYGPDQSDPPPLLVLPLKIEDEMAGSLVLAGHHSQNFSPEDIDLAWRVVDQVAGALAKSRLIETQRRLITAIEQAADSIIITDPAGTILYVNPAFERVSGYSRVEAIGQNPRLFKSDRHGQPFYVEMWNTLTAGRVWHGRLINKRQDGAFFTEEATITPVRGENGAIISYVAVKRDITQALHLEEQLRQAQKMEAVGRLAGGVAHDFNNLLTVISGHAELLLTDYPDEHDHIRDDLAQILRAGERASVLTRQLLAFSRKQVLQSRVIDLNDIVADVGKMLNRLIGEDIDLVTAPGQNLARIQADPGQIEQIIMNLAVNARDAMPYGGKLTIETTNVYLDNEYASQHTNVEPGWYVMLALSDTGIGMNAETQSRIFEPFFTTKSMDEGTGLGLATIYGIVKQSNGHIWFYSELGHGTTFKIYLPRLENSVQEIGQRQPVVTTTQSGSETILVVEDEDEVRNLVQYALQRNGYTVLQAHDGQAAVQLCQQYRQEIHLLLTDVVMPGSLTGQQLVDQLTVLHSEMKVLYMSGYPDSNIVHRGVLEAGTAFLQKPFTPNDLNRKVREILDS